MIKKRLSLENEPCCSKACKKNTDNLNSKITELSNKLDDKKERELKYLEKIRTLEYYNKSYKECIETLKKKLETLQQEKEVVDGKLAGLLTASKDLDNLIESQRSDKNKEGLGYNDIVTDYSRPSPTIESSPDDAQNKNPSTENGESTDSILSKPAVKFVKASERSTSNKVEAVKKPSVRYAKLYRKPSKKPTVRGNQRNWNNLKSQQLGTKLKDSVRTKRSRGTRNLKIQKLNIKFKGDLTFNSLLVSMQDIKQILRKPTLFLGKLMCWSAKKQQFVAMSLAEAEYVAATGCCATILWMKSQLTDYDIIYKRVPIFCDNTSAIAISNNPVLHLRTKHIDIKYHFIRDHVLKGDIELHFIPTQYQLVDIFTKPLEEPTFKTLIVELEPSTLDKPESPNPFLPASQVDFTFDDVTFTTNNEVVLLYPSHPNQDCFEAILDFISKCGLKEAFTKAPNQYKEYLSEVWYTTKTLDDSKGIGERLGQKELSKRVNFLLGGELTINLAQVFSVHNLTLKPNQPEEPPFTDHMKAIYNLDVPMDFKAPKPSSQTKEVPQGKKPGAKSGLKRKRSLTHLSPPLRHLNLKLANQKRKLSPLLAKDKSPSHPSPLTPVVGDMHKETQQEAGGLTYLGVTSEEGAHPQLNSDTRSAFFTPDSPPYEPIIISDESEEEEEVVKDKDTSSKKEELKQAKAKAKAKVEGVSMKAKPSYPYIHQLIELLVTSLKPELSKLLALHDFASFLPTELKELPSKITRLSKDIKGLKKHVRDIEIELPVDLKEIPTKPETFTSTIFIVVRDFYKKFYNSLGRVPNRCSSSIAKTQGLLSFSKGIAEFLSLPVQVALVQAKLITLDALPSLLLNVTKALNMFAQVLDSASSKAGDQSVPSVGQSDTIPAERKKNTNQATIS
nr:retrovirus-related Pol polyprotein from transposon TNT 1-94 [Tanacetum cinerariifolium]